jgi:GTPase SAR1 family protein
VPVRHIKKTIQIVGETRCRPPARKFGIYQSDRLFHVVMFGQTGTGKSTLMKKMMSQDLEQKQGFCLIDPHGDLAKEVMQLAGNQARYWEPADQNCPLGYNPLSFVSDEYRPLVASGLIETLKKQWADAWGARMEHLLRYAVLALLEHPNSDLRDIIPLFTNKAYRTEVVSHITDEQVLYFWKQEFPNMNYKTAIDGVAPIANKLGTFLAHPNIRKMMCEPDEPIRFRKEMDQGKVLIVNLAKGRLGTDISNVLGGMIVSNLALAAFSRENVALTERKPYFLYVDEFPSFTTDAFAGMLSELRKYRLGIVASTQFTAQLSKETLESVLGNVGTLVSFRVGATDASLLAKQFASDIPSQRDLANLPNYRMFVSLMIDGRQSRPISSQTVV